MTRIQNILIISTLLMCYFNQIQAAESPYLKVLNTDVDIDRMPLLLTTVDAQISGMMVEVKVTQLYKNNGNVPLEAQYVFPGSDQAAVHEMTMKLADRVLKAEIQEKQQAKRTYQQAKAEGKTTSLLEQADPGLFTMRVANILPGDEINVELIYSEKLIPINGKYRFNYPAIGMPSVLHRNHNGRVLNDDEMGFDMALNIDTPITIEDIRSLNHQVDVEYTSDHQARVLLDLDETLNFKEDFVIEYSLQGEQINSGVLVYEDHNNDEGYFLMMVEPPQKIDKQSVVPKEYIFVVDSSGSMEGAPLTMAQDVTKALLAELQPHELFNVVLFAGGSELLSDYSMSPTPENIKKAIQMVDISNAGGGTNLYNAIDKIQSVPLTEGYSRSLLVLTDGAIAFSDDTFNVIRDNNHKHNVFAIGVSQYNTDMPAVKKIAQAGQGQEFIVDSPEKLQDIQRQFLDYIRYPILTDINVELIGMTDIDIQPQRMGDLFSRRPLFLTGKYDLSNKGSIEISGRGGQKRYAQVVDLASLQSNDGNESIKYLWAKEKILTLGGGSLRSYKEEDKVKIAEVTALGLKYNVLTDYTSFVAVDEVSRTKQLTTPVGDALSNNTPAAVLNSFGYGYIDSNEEAYAHKRLPQLMVQQEMASNATELSDDEITPKRPSITFILGEDRDSSNVFYGSAKQFFTDNDDYKTDVLVASLRSLSEVKAYLQAHSKQSWGVINIVTHASMWSGLTGQFDGDVVDTDVFALTEMIAGEQFQPLSNGVVDEHTEVRFLGCSLGKHEQLLRTLSIYFGGRDQQRPIIKSPQDFIYFAIDDAHMKTFKNGFALLHPKYLDKPGQMSRQLSKKQPLLNIDSLEGWQQKQVSISTVVTANHLVKAHDALSLAKKQSNIAKYIKSIGAQWTDFDWQISHEMNHVTIVGHSVLMKQKLRNILTQQLTILDLSDPNMTTIIRPN